jgi:YD repeat-containing protein
MPLEKEYIRDRKRRIIGSVTTGYVGSFESIVRDDQNNITGSTSERFNTTRDEQDKLVSINTSDPGLLIGRRK